MRAEHLAVADDAADRDAAEADAVIAALAADQARARGLARARCDRRARSSARCRPLPSPNCRRTRGRGRPARAPRCGSRARRPCGWPNWNAGAIVELGRLLLDRLDDRRRGCGRHCSTTGPAVPSSTGAAVRRVVVHVLGARDQARRLLERAVRRERHPEGFEIVRDGCDRAGGKRHGILLRVAGASVVDHAISARRARGMPRRGPQRRPCRAAGSFKDRIAAAERRSQSEQPCHNGMGTIFTVKDCKLYDPALVLVRLHLQYGWVATADVECAIARADYHPNG